MLLQKMSYFYFVCIPASFRAQVLGRLQGEVRPRGAEDRRRQGRQALGLQYEIELKLKSARET